MNLDLLLIMGFSLAFFVGMLLTITAWRISLRKGLVIVAVEAFFMMTGFCFFMLAFEWMVDFTLLRAGISRDDLIPATIFSLAVMYTLTKVLGKGRRITPFEN